jgi:hypothetical protein
MVAGIGAPTSQTHSNTLPLRSNTPWVEAPSGAEPTTRGNKQPPPESCMRPTSTVACAQSSTVLSFDPVQGKERFVPCEVAAYCHSSSVGSRLPSDAQNATASNQLTHVIG